MSELDGFWMNGCFLKSSDGVACFVHIRENIHVLFYFLNLREKLGLFIGVGFQGCDLPLH